MLALLKAVSAGCDAYALMNNECNLGLRAFPAAGATVNSFTIAFNKIVPPFETVNDPVLQYYLLLVKEYRKLLFTISDAGNSIKNFEGCCISIAQHEFNNGRFEGICHTDGRNDTDGEPITTGMNYVVFVMAGGDFLSAPSATFCLTHLLPAAKNIRVDEKDTLKSSIKSIDTSSLEDNVEMNLIELFIEKNFKIGDAIPKELELTEALGVNRTIFLLMESVIGYQ
jgi:hypothetical protein